MTVSVLRIAAVPAVDFCGSRIRILEHFSVNVALVSGDDTVKI